MATKIKDVANIYNLSLDPQKWNAKNDCLNNIIKEEQSKLL